MLNSRIGIPSIQLLNTSLTTEAIESTINHFNSFKEQLNRLDCDRYNELIRADIDSKDIQFEAMCYINIFKVILDKLDPSGPLECVAYFLEMLSAVLEKLNDLGEIRMEFGDMLAGLKEIHERARLSDEKFSSSEELKQESKDNTAARPKKLDYDAQFKKHNERMKDLDRRLNEMWKQR